MAFEKNDPRINRKGRPTGSPNKTTDEIRTMLQDFISANMDSLQSDFEAMEPKDKLSFIERLLKHILPQPLHELERLTDEQLDILIEKLKQQHNERKTA